jgi:hypothetical protein
VGKVDGTVVLRRHAERIAATAGQNAANAG